MNKILIVSLSQKAKRFESEIKKTTNKILKILGKDNVHLEIYLASPQKLRFLNKKYRKKNKAANILSFEEPKDFLYPDKQRRIGEIFLSDSAVLNKEKLVPLLIHGILHLFGYQHQTKSDRIKMEKKEQRLLNNL